MTSARKVAANRRNGRKSRGPRSAAGKSIASRNALRHGLAAMIHRRAPPLREVENFAQALCGDDNDPLLFDKALAIAQEEFVLRAIAGNSVRSSNVCGNRQSSRWQKVTTASKW